jgi:hypothetical protein
MISSNGFSIPLVELVKRWVTGVTMPTKAEIEDAVYNRAMDAMGIALNVEEAAHLLVLLLRENMRAQYSDRTPRRNRQIRLVSMRLPTGEGVL